MSTVKTTYVQHPSAATPAMELHSDGSVTVAGITTSDIDARAIVFAIALGG
jgi:hypothetical protein